MKNFLNNFFDLATLKRFAWYAGTQAVVLFVATMSNQIESIAEPTTGTLFLGLILAQITKALNK